MRKFSPTIILFLLSLLSVPTGAGAGVRTGLDRWVEGGFAELRGKRVGLVVNHTAVDRRGRHLLDLLRETAEVEPAAVFTPEHGFTGAAAHGQRVADGVVPGTDIPLYSLYGRSRRPTPAQLADLDALVFDVQDAGARFYTYITTLGYVLEEAARAGLPLYVLDRPNPAGGSVIEGEILLPSIRHFTAYYSIPARHGLTVGELARFYNNTAKLGADLHVVSMTDWQRAAPWRATGLRFRPPSPNIRTPREAILYTGIGGFEATNVAVGRGTDHPFELFGAPWMDAPTVAARLNDLRLPGFRFRPIRFTPKTDRYAGQACRGVSVRLADESTARTIDLFLHALWILRDRHPAEFQPRWEEMPRITGSSDVEALYKSGAPVEEALRRAHEGARRFKKIRAEYLIY